MPKVAKQEESPRDAADFEVPVIKPSSLTWQDQGQCYKTAFIRLPEHLIAQDLHDFPDRLWVKIQADQIGKALSQFDKVICVSFAEDWLLEATVAQASLTRVVLAGHRVVQLPGAVESLFADQTYQVKWAGDGYGIYRVSDSIRVGNESFQRPDIAKAALLRLYPTQVAS